MAEADCVIDPTGSSLRQVTHWLSSKVTTVDSNKLEQGCKMSLCWVFLCSLGFWRTVRFQLSGV